MEKRKLPILIAAIALCMLSCNKNNVSSGSDKLPNMIIDTDVGIDDAMAILYLLQRSDLTVKGITICGTGMSNMGAATENTLGLLALAGQPDIPVARGETIAINSQNTNFRPQQWLDESNSMMGLELPSNPTHPLNQSAVNFIIDVLERSGTPIRFVVLGPMTNLGSILLQAPHLAEKIESVYVMGGSVNVPGNLPSGGIENNTVAEWNIFLDPDAAEIVFKSGVNVILAPLDATNKAPVTTAFLTRIANDHTTPEATFVFDILSKLEQYYDTLYFWERILKVFIKMKNNALIDCWDVGNFN